MTDIDGGRVEAPGRRVVEAAHDRRRPLAGAARDPAHAAPDGWLRGRGRRGRAPETSDQLARLRPDVVLVDDMHHTGHAVARLREIREQRPAAMALLLSLPMDDERLEEAFEAGADAVLSKAMHPVALGTLLRELVRGNVAQRPRPVREVVTAGDCPLTARELEVLRLVADGHTNGQIARRLWVTEQTVKFHLSNTYRKLGVSNRTEASRYAHLNDLVAPLQRLAS